MPNSKTVLITGGTSGIGLALAHVFAEHGHDLVIVARKLDELESAKKSLEEKYRIKVETLVKDLTLPSAVEELYAEIKGKGITIDILVNNAGFAKYGKFQTISVENDQQVLELNMATLTKLTKLFLNDFLARNDGRILNVASTAAFQPGPYMAVYYATKAYVLSLSEALAEELIGTKVTVTVVCPGPTKTSFQEKSAISKTRLIARNNLMSAENVARAAYAGLMTGRTLVIPGIRNKLMVQSLRLAPRKLVVKIVRWLQEPN